MERNFDMSNFEHIFSPIKIGSIQIKNRIEVAPGRSRLLSINCDITREEIENIKALARGGPGIVTIGDTPINNEKALRGGYCYNLGTDKSINGLNRIAETIQRYGAKASIELSHHDLSSPADMTLEEIKMLIKSYADAAYRCMLAGMDMIMVHGAHGQFISQFFSPRRNNRTDKYGGTVKNRARFVLELLEAIREKVGDRLAIEYRISAEEFTPGGLSFEEQLEFAKMIQDKIDLLHVSAGYLYEEHTLPRMFQPCYIERGINVHFAELFKKELSIPVATVGSLTLEMAEQIIASKKADIVAMKRAFIADPDSIKKAKSGQSDLIRPCVRCNSCIERTHTFHLSVRCAVNPGYGREVEFVNMPAPMRKKKVVVIGGGPAGMVAARTAAERGHEVVLFEKDNQLGGNLLFASAAPFKEDMRKYLEWAIRITMNTPNIAVKLSTEATPEKIEAERPDVLIIAVGSAPITPAIPGVEKKHVFWAGDVLLGKAKVGDSVIVVGAGLTGSETALYLAQQRKKVTLIDILPLEKIDAEIPTINIITLRNMLSKSGVFTRTEVKLSAITDSSVIILDKKEDKTEEIPCDTVVLSLGLEPRRKLVEAFEKLATEVYIIGDCINKRGNLMKATTEGFWAAIEI